MEKRCSKCAKVKPLSDFADNPTAKDGKRSSCKKCKNIGKYKPGGKEGSKVCYTCKIVKPYTDFARNIGRADNYCYECKECEKARRTRTKNINYAHFYYPVNDF